MAITPLPTPVPSRDDPTNFASRADAFLGALPDFATEANALALEMEANAALNLLSVTATSTTSLAISAASKTFVTQSGKGFAIGMRLKATDTANTANYMTGDVTAYSGTSLTILMDEVGGSGTIASWSITMAVPSVEGTIPIDAFIAYRDVGNTFSLGASTFLKTGVIATAATYPSATSWTLNDAATWVAKTGVSGTFNFAGSSASGAGITVITQFTGTTTYMTTADGSTFTSRTFPSSGSWRVAFGNGIFLAIDFTGSATTSYTSTDGINWTSRTVTANATSYGAPIFGNGKFVIPAGNTAWLVTTDGITYSAVVGITSSASSQGAYGNGKFVIVDGATSVLTSADGISWVSEVSGSAAGSRKVRFGNGQFVIYTSQADGGVYVSPDGATWTPYSPPLSLGIVNGFTDCCFGNGIFFFTSGSSTSTAYKTSDFITWTTVTLSSSTVWDMAVFSSVANAFCVFDAGTTSATTSITTGSYVGSPNAVYAGGDYTKPMYMRVA